MLHATLCGIFNGIQMLRKGVSERALSERPSTEVFSILALDTVSKNFRTRE